MQLEQGRPRRLVYGPNVRTDFRLMECSEDLLKTVLQDGVVLKGGPHDDAVLCTATRTYAVKYVETTNLQLLVCPEHRGAGGKGRARQYHPFLAPELLLCNTGNGDTENTPCGALSLPGLQTQLHWLARGSSCSPAVTVAATNHAHLEVVEIAPRLGRLEQLLSQRPYGLLDEDAQHDGAGAEGPAGALAGRYTFDELLCRVQASAAELQEGLRSLGAVELGGCWQLVDPSYLGSVLELIISSSQQAGYPLDAIPAAELSGSLGEHGIEGALVAHCLSIFGAPSGQWGQGPPQAKRRREEDGRGGARGLWALKEDKVCCYYVSKLLAGGRQMPANELLRCWKAAVPEGMQPSLDMLKGEALLTGKGSSAAVKSFPAGKLPRDPALRFEALFAERPKWEGADLEPYIADIKVPGLSTGALILRYARSSQQSPDQPVTYSKR